MDALLSGKPLWNKTLITFGARLVAASTPLTPFCLSNIAVMVSRLLQAEPLCGQVVELRMTPSTRISTPGQIMSRIRDSIPLQADGLVLLEQ